MLVLQCARRVWKLFGGEGSDDGLHAPESHAVVIWTDDGGQTTDDVGISNAFHDVEMQFPLIVGGELLAVTRFDKVHDHVVVFEGFGEAEGGLLVLAFVEDPDSVVSG